MKPYSANGKLLITGEYAVLDYAKAFAIPSKLGQSMTVETVEDSKNNIHWTSYDSQKNIWFNQEFNLNELRISGHNIENQLIKLFLAIKQLQPDFFQNNYSYHIKTYLDFPNEWGLGSSSTLISLLSQWAGINPYKLLELTFGGSGYDIACASTNVPILYQNKTTQEVKFNPDFKNDLFFIYLNQKQNSREGINLYKKIPKNQKLINQISEISENIIHSQSLHEFENYLTEHENLLSNHLSSPTIKKQLFPDYKGVIKSLGAWGGDFILVTKRDNTLGYFKQKGYHTILKYSDLFY